MTYLDGDREQREVEQGDRFKVIRRFDTYYVVADGQRRALIAIGSVIPVEAPRATAQWDYVVTTANAPIVVWAGRTRLPDVAQAGEVFEVLGRHPTGATLYVLWKGGRTAELAASLVRAAKPRERPAGRAAPAAGRRVPLGCEISIDRQRRVRVETVYPGSLGERLGLARGAIILKVNGQEIHSAADYDRASALRGGNLRLLVQNPGLDYPEMIEYQHPASRR
jgi:membrane-associated protease RseP (regulator of RpoE activity)